MKFGRAIFASTAVATPRNVSYKPLDDEPLLSTVYNVEICSVGIEYPLASGPMTFTTGDLLEAVASQDDPAVQPPRVWLGHPDDDRFHAGRATPAGSAEPALGKVTNLRVEDEGMTLVGDIVGCPTWLARILASAYPSRSIEGGKDVLTATGRTWKMVVTDLALLGVRWPGVSNIADLEALYSEDGPDGVEVVEGDPIAATRAITAQIEIDDVRRAFYEDAEVLRAIGGYPWIRSMQLAPNTLIVDDDNGELWRVPFEVEGDAVTFGDAEQVKIQYVTASQATNPEMRGLVVNMLTRDQKVIASWDQRAASRPESTNQEDPGMTPEQIRLLRERLNLTEDQLPDNASQEQIDAALRGEAQPDPGDGNQPNEGDPNENPGADPGVGNQPATPPAEGSPEAIAAARATLEAAGMVAVPAEGWQQVQANAAAGARVAEQTEQQRREGIIASAIQEGRIAPAQRANFRTMFERDAQGAETLLTAAVEKGGLMPNTIPVTARGADPSVESMNTEAYPTSWLPELASKDAANAVTVEA